MIALVSQQRRQLPDTATEFKCTEKPVTYPQYDDQGWDEIQIVYWNQFFAQIRNGRM